MCLSVKDDVAMPSMQYIHYKTNIPNVIFICF